MIYLDTSAAAKLVDHEDHSDALTLYVTERLGEPVVASALLVPELIRAVTRRRPDLQARAWSLLQRIMTMPLTTEVVRESATIDGPALRTLDALHLATARTVESELTALVTYDVRLVAAAQGLGLPTASPS